MKNLKYMLLALLAFGLGSCHTPEEPTFAADDSVGITSLTARFVSGPYSSDPNAAFTAAVTSTQQTEIVISIPWYYPETSDNQVTDITRMRVQAATEAGTVITPALGVLDLTKSTRVSVQLPNGRTKEYTIRGSIDKLTGNEIDALTAVDSNEQRFDAIVDNDSRIIMIGTTEEVLEGCTITSRLSPHAKIVAPDLSKPIDIREGDIFTVAAHNGATRDFEVKFVIPEKTDYGMRPKSDKKMFIKYFSQDYGISLPAGASTRLAVQGNNLLLSTGSNIYAFDRFSGEAKGEIAAPAGLTIHSLTNDEAGNLLFAAMAGPGAEFKVFRARSLEETPQELFTYVNPFWCNGMSNLRVVGDIDQKAVITAMADLENHWTAWQIENGAVSGDPVEGVFGCFTSTLWSTQSATIIGASTDLQDGLFALGYGGLYDLFHYDMATGSWSSAVDTSAFVNSNNNPNCLSLVEFNKARYIAFTVGTHFTWSFVEVYVYDASNISTMNDAQAFHMSSSEIMGSFVGVTGATSDVLLVPSEDGYKLSLYFIDGNYDVMGSYEFDCVKK